MRNLLGKQKTDREGLCEKYHKSERKKGRKKEINLQYCVSFKCTAKCFSLVIPN
uniref:Uncharacterized protein n=1 Tax=Sus scrofa TaxID=9823 RepID=A0A8D1TCM1_PIG